MVNMIPLSVRPPARTREKVKIFWSLETFSLPPLSLMIVPVLCSLAFLDAVEAARKTGHGNCEQACVRLALNLSANAAGENLLVNGMWFWAFWCRKAPAPCSSHALTAILINGRHRLLKLRRISRAKHLRTLQVLALQG